MKTIEGFRDCQVKAFHEGRPARHFRIHAPGGADRPGCREVTVNDALPVNHPRSAPRLRRVFPALGAERVALLRERNRLALADDPRRVGLERRLLDLGGSLALLFLPDPHLGQLLDRGRWYPGARALMRRGQPSRCHANAAMLLVATEGTVRIATGYALSADGLWRQHSWGVAEDGRVIETTARRVRYYGFVLNYAEAWKWTCKRDPPWSCKRDPPRTSK